jgi:methyl-accepting chemotaxis protein
MNFQNLRIGTKLWLAVGLLIAALLALATFATVRSSVSQARAEEAASLAENKIRLATHWSQVADSAMPRALAMALNSDAVVAKVLGEANTAAAEKATELQKQLAALPQTDAEQALAQKTAAARQAWLEAAAKVPKLKEGGDAEAARAEAGKNIAAAAAPYLAALAEFVKLQEDGLQQTQAQVAAERQLTMVIALVAIGLIVTGLVSGTWLLAGSIRAPLDEAVALAGSIAAGDLSQRRRDPVVRGDELGDLLRALLAMNDSLASTVGQVRGAAESIQTASAEIATGNGDLSQRTEQTASNLQKTASALEQLTGTVKQSAESAHTANQLASSAAQVAHRGGTVVSQVVSTMDEINTASKRIADIIGTIDGIAFQTNILALNAAVEAARAGEQGRGFAVVASEVRSLAQRSADAAKEIKALIGASVDKVESGSKLVADAGSTMSEIVTSVQRVSDIIGEITAAAAEQSQGIGQVNGAVIQLDQMTQQNAALVEESAAAAESLKEQAARLASLVSAFHVGGEAAPVARRVIAAAATRSAVAPRPAVKPAATKPAAAPQARAPASAPPAAPAPAPAPASTSAPAPAPASPKPAVVADKGQSDADWETF